MDLALSNEQTMLHDMVGSFLTDRYGFDQRRTALEQAPHWRPDIWQAMAGEIGVLGASFSEELGGFGGGATENMVLMEAFGASLVVEPYLPSVVLGGGFLKHSGHPAAAELVASVIAGETILAFAQAERDSRYNLAAIATRASVDGAGWVIDGHKKLVLAAPAATHFLVTARTSGEMRDAAGVSVFLVDAKSLGVNIRDYVTFDGQIAGDVTFENVKLGADALLGELSNGLPLIERVVDEGIAAICAEAVGVLAQMMERTLVYARERKQFGAAISSFQALQHRMADMFIEVEQARSMAALAAIRVDEGDPLARARAVSMAKVQIGMACRKVGQSAIQIHGGMGMTDEMPISHYFKRASVIEGQFGSVDHHLARIERLAAP